MKEEEEEEADELQEVVKRGGENMSTEAVLVVRCNRVDTYAFIEAACWKSNIGTQGWRGLRDEGIYGCESWK